MKNPQLVPLLVLLLRLHHRRRIKSWSGPQCRTSTRDYDGSSPPTSATTRRKSSSSSRKLRWVLVVFAQSTRSRSMRIIHSFCSVLHLEPCMNLITPTYTHTNSSEHGKCKCWFYPRFSYVTSRTCTLLMLCVCSIPHVVFLWFQQ